MGVELQKAGYTNISGMDGAAEMLARCVEKGIYRDTWEVLVGVTQIPAEALYDAAVEGSGFDAVFCSACMLKGNMPSDCYEYMLRVMRPGAHMIFTIREQYLNPETDFGMNYGPKLAGLVEQGRLELVEKVEYLKYPGL